MPIGELRKLKNEFDINGDKDLKVEFQNSRNPFFVNAVKSQDGEWRDVHNNQIIRQAKLFWKVGFSFLISLTMFIYFLPLWSLTESFFKRNTKGRITQLQGCTTQMSWRAKFFFLENLRPKTDDDDNFYLFILDGYFYTQFRCSTNLLYVIKYGSACSIESFCIHFDTC